MRDCYAIVVDGYSSGSLYVNGLKSLGIETIHIKSYPCSVPFLLNSHHSGLYKADLEYDGDYQKLVDKIKVCVNQKPIGAIYIGTTAFNGFYLADRLSQDFNIPGNKPETTMHRVDKYQMNDVLARSNVSTLRQLLSSDLAELRKWMRSLNVPILLKPLLSGGADGIFICKTEKELEESYQKHASITHNVYGSRNPSEYNGKVLAQEFLSGTEYVVCTFSSKGKHVITSIWKSEKRLICDGINKARDYLELLSPHESSEFSILHEYIEKVLNALGIENGPCNSDIIIDSERGPLLLEVNPRIPGGMDPLVFLHALGDSYIHQTIEWSLFPEKIPNSYVYPFEQHVFCVSLLAHTNGYIPLLDTSEITKLPSCVKAIIKPKIGDYVQKTTDITNLTGMVYLTGSSKDLLLKDISIIREWEQIYFGDKLQSEPINSKPSTQEQKLEKSSFGTYLYNKFCENKGYILTAAAGVSVGVALCNSKAFKAK